MKGNNNLLTVEQTSKAIETQLRRAQGGSGDSSKDAFSAQSQPEQTTDEDLKARQQEARAWINAWQDSPAIAAGSGSPSTGQADSQKVLAEVRANNPLLTKEQEQAAMERLLNQGTRSVEDNDVKVESNQASSNGSNGSSDSAESQGGKYAPKETFEDGSVMYAAADLEATDYEAVLTS